MTVDLDVGGRRYRATVTEAGRGNVGRLTLRLEAVLDGEVAADDTTQFDVQPTAEGYVLLDVASGRVVDAAVFPQRRGNWLVQLPGIDVDVVVGRPATAQVAAGAAGEQLVSAPMPGRVLKVLVARGDVVTAGQPLIVIEAMKMENALTAAHAGTVEDVSVEEGTSVEAGRPLIRLR